MRGAQLGENLEPVHPRHHQVEQHQVDAGLPRLGQPRRAVGRLDDLVSGDLERVHDAAADRVLIFDHQDRFFLCHIAVSVILREPLPNATPEARPIIIVGKRRVDEMPQGWHVRP